MFEETVRCDAMSQKDIDEIHALKEVAINQRARYFTLIAPYIKMQSDIINIQPVRYIKSLDAMRGESYARIIDWEPGSEKLFKQIQEVIDYIARETFKPGGLP
jgi:hypothetical protein